MWTGYIWPTPPRSLSENELKAIKDVGHDTWNLFLDRESSAAHDGERTGRGYLVSSRPAWSASIRDVVSSGGDVGSTCPG